MMMSFRGFGGRLTRGPHGDRTHNQYESKPPAATPHYGALPRAVAVAGTCAPSCCEPAGSSSMNLAPLH